MTTSKLLAIMAVFLLALTGIRITWIQLQADPGRVDATGGIADLRAWEMPSNSIWTLNGEWEFYPYSLIDPARPNADAGDPDGEANTVRLPSDWSGLMDKSWGDPSYGYASYRLRLLLPPIEQDYSIRMPYIPASAALYVNGSLVAESGRPAERAADYKPASEPITGTFAAAGEADVIIHVANYDDRIMSGIMQPVKFGTESGILRSYLISAGTQLAVGLLLFAHIVYAVVLYFIGFRQRALLSFGLMIACATVSLLIDDDRILVALSGLNYEWTWKLYYWSYMGASVFLLHYMTQLLPPSRNSRPAQAFYSVCALYALAVLFLPARLISYTDIVHTVLIVIPLLVVSYAASRAVRTGNTDMVYVLLGLAAITTNLAWGIARNAGLYEGGFYPVDISVTFLMFALYWFRSYVRTTEQTVRLADRLKEANERKDEFLVNTSHELRNPLHGILSIAQSVLETGDRNGENRARLELLISVGKRMSHLLSDLTDLNRYNENRISLRLSDVRLPSVATGVLDMVRFLTEGKPVKLINAVPNDLPLVRADENRLVQILFNLLHNAAKFTHEGEVTIRARRRDDKVSIEVTDTGIGMDEATINRIFDRYEQGDSDTTGSIAGLGLGLAISKGLAELHGTELTVASRRGRGSTFAFFLPIAAGSDEQEERAADRLPAQDPIEDGAQAATGEDFGEDHPVPLLSDADIPRILAVDDDPVNLLVLRQALEREGYEIATTVSAKEAAGLLDRGRWDLLVADVMMPGMSGYELTREVRTRFSRSELPVLLLTARTRMEDIEAGFRSGANDYIAKPVDSTELRARVKALTEVARAAREQARLEAAWLQAQIEPHFLFNTLNSVAALSEIDTVRMRGLLDAFGDYLRASFDFRNGERLVPLRQELDLVRAYLLIEQARFGELIRVVWEIDESLQAQVPPLTIQPLVENAVRHGLLRRSGAGTVSISVRQAGDWVLIAVRDDGAGMDGKTLREALRRRPADGKRRGVGLLNTDYRLKQLFGEGLRIESSEGHGTEISFRCRLSASP